MTHAHDEDESMPGVSDAMVEIASAAYAQATGYYVEFHKGLRSESSDKIRRGMRAALSALDVPAHPEGVKDANPNSQTSGSDA